MIDRTIKIGGLRYELNFVDAYELDGACGECNCGRCSIRVNRDIPPAQQRATILHEVIEAINWHLELDLEHRHIQGLEHALHQVLTDNRDLFSLPLAEGDR